MINCGVVLRWCVLQANERWMPLSSLLPTLCVLLLCVWPTADASAPKVLAASSLTDALERVAEQYRTDTGSSLPVLGFASSQRLARQVVEGVPADIVATAHPDWMDYLIEEGAVASWATQELLHNEMVVAALDSSTLTAASLSDLQGAGFERLGIANEWVPAGMYAREVLEHSGVFDSLQSKFIVAASAQATVELGIMNEVDAVFVYRTDVVAEPRLRLLFPMDASAHSPIQYPFALTDQGMSSPEARAFFEYLMSPSAQALFEQYGFSKGEFDFLSPPSESRIRHGGTDVLSVGPPLQLSLWIALISLFVSIVPAIGLGWLLARRNLMGKALLSTLCLSPLVLPPVVTGVLLLRLFGRSGVLGPYLDSIGIQLVFTQWAAVVAAAVVGFPLLLILVRQAIESVDVRYEQLAQTLGLTPWQAFLRVTLPMALPGIAAGCVLAFARAMGEFGATAMVAGDQPEETRTIALAVYALAERPGSEDGITTLVWLSLGISLCALFVFERLVWRQRRLREEREYL